MQRSCSELRRLRGSNSGLRRQVQDLEDAQRRIRGAGPADLR